MKRSIRAVTTGSGTELERRILAIVRDWKPQRLTPEQIDLISRQLDERCRDVEDRAAIARTQRFQSLQNQDLRHSCIVSGL